MTLPYLFIALFCIFSYPPLILTLLKGQRRRGKEMNVCYFSDVYISEYFFFFFFPCSFPNAKQTAPKTSYFQNKTHTVFSIMSPGLLKRCWALTAPMLPSEVGILANAPCLQNQEKQEIGQNKTEGNSGELGCVYSQRLSEVSIFYVHVAHGVPPLFVSVRKEGMVFIW